MIPSTQLLEKRDEDKIFWATRSQKYRNLEWANRGGYLQAFLNAGSFKRGDTVLDVGTGTGIVARSVAPMVKKVIGIDICTEMLAKAAQQPMPNVVYQIGDAYRLPFEDELFDKLTARMVFHHLVRRTQQGMKECHRVLKSGGTIVFSEGVPPTPHVVPFYTRMFRLKEKRITFMESDLIRLIRAGGFSRVRKEVYFARQCSIRNWLENSNLEKGVQDKIFQMHLDLDNRGKKDYNMTLKDGDCFIDMKFVILTGVKK